MEPCVPCIYLTYCMEYVWTNIMNRYISKSYTTCKYWPTIYRAGAAVVSTITSKENSSNQIQGSYKKNATIFQVLFQKRKLFWSDFQLLKNNNGFKCFLASGNLVKPSHPFRNITWKMVAVFLYEPYFWLLLFPFLLTGKLTLLIA